MIRVLSISLFLGSLFALGCGQSENGSVPPTPAAQTAPSAPAAPAAPAPSAQPATRTVIVDSTAPADAHLWFAIREQGVASLSVAYGAAAPEVIPLQPFATAFVYAWSPEVQANFLHAHSEVSAENVLLNGQSCTGDACMIRVVVHRGDELVVYGGAVDNNTAGVAIERTVPLHPGTTRFIVDQLGTEADEVQDDEVNPNGIEER